MERNIRLLDSPIFINININILFEDWKFRVRDKLIINNDYYSIKTLKII